ncbi:sigma-54-dependent transcriptional regulator [Oceanimonas baumannii]|uniref:DNA-binding NtrC family response regulator n=1 Tax=Oceanimonas baumannii TaxID=129578 RepID=A0A235CLX0_9GAMM|nr:sigma-54 dependent transcriptional regulator [Oceanimonas baumannii]OYD25588.1 sigma-54-dependent Fis family transcriptional regulator [Oceanimonas baumannii]TDW61202.1 DNA-binding NtrC family response regulator [Oceanimonas baumannii]
MNNLTILVIDDERNLIRSIRFALMDQHIEVLGAATAREGLELARTSLPDVILLDLGLPDMSGLELLPQLRQTLPDIPVIMISAHGDTRAAVRAVKEGALDYITKPFEWDELVMLIRRSSERSHMARELSFHRRRHEHTHRLVGNSPQMEQLRQTLELIGRSSGKTMLISGPSGTGKALVARSLHDVRFTDAPFIEINCAALPEQLIEAELFGAERGAYTGATQHRNGLIALADGGTLFLDEIGELPLPLQAKLLSFLENRSYRPIGGSREIQADVVVMAATNRDLKTEVTQGNFRSDLYYRLNILPIHAPPLAARGDDITLLIHHFSDQFARQEGCEPPHWSTETLRLLCAYAWPGNVRELRNLVERITILHAGQDISPEYLPSEYLDSTNTPAATSLYTEAIEDKERRLILDALQETDGHKGLAAERLGISRHALKRRIQRLGL